MCRGPHTNQLANTSYISYNLSLTLLYLELASDLPGKGSIPQDCFHISTTCKSGCPLCFWSTGINQRLPWLPPWFSNLPEQLTELRNNSLYRATSLLQRIQLRYSQMKSSIGQGIWELLCLLQACHVPSTFTCSQTGRSPNHILWVIMETSLCGHDWLNHWLSVINWTFSPLPLPEVGGVGPKFQHFDHLFGSLGNSPILWLSRGFPKLKVLA